MGIFCSFCKNLEDSDNNNSNDSKRSNVYSPILPDSKIDTVLPPYQPQYNPPTRPNHLPASLKVSNPYTSHQVFIAFI